MEIKNHRETMPGKESSRKTSIKMKQPQLEYFKLELQSVKREIAELVKMTDIDFSYNNDKR
ncbi:MAG: hypothetical protein LBP72_06880 [Dysgonamonadaceae bacterium]|jgi:hypothetical protein|nr:hypothetical protein [Dysgonamonadaceae bacterium]